MELLQWPAMLVTVTAAWMMPSARERKRHVAFGLYLAGNALWLAWAVHDGAWALVLLQVALAALNLRGARRTDPDDEHSG